MGRLTTSLPLGRDSFLRQFLKSLERKVRQRFQRWLLGRREVALRRAAQRIDLGSLTTRLSNRPHVPLLAVIDQPSPEQLDRCLKSVLAQAYPNWQLRIVIREADRAGVTQCVAAFGTLSERVRVTSIDTAAWTVASALRVALRDVTEPLVGLLSGGEVLEPDALLWMVASWNRHPEATWIYGDELEIDGQGHPRAFQYKPDFSWPYLWARFFPGRFGLYASEALRRALAENPRADADGWYDLALRLSECVESRTIVHVPQILLGVPEVDVSSAAALARGESERIAVEDALRRRGVKGRVTLHPLDPRLRQFELTPARFPRVSIVIPNRDAPQMLKTCIAAARAATGYPNYEIVVIDHASREPALLTYLEEESRAGRLRVVPYRREFNFADMNNQAIATTSGEWLVLLNNDVDGFSSGWLEQLVATGDMDPTIAAVGTLLYYPDGTIQHGGVFFGLGQTGRHGHIDLPHDALGYCGRLRSLQEVSASTAALMLVRRQAFDAIRGFDTKYPSDYNDFDLCLRLRQAGYRVLYTPHVTACHYSSKTRRHRDWRRGVMRRQWGDLLLHDPFYNPNLSNQLFELSPLNGIWAQRKRVALNEYLA